MFDKIYRELKNWERHMSKREREEVDKYYEYQKEYSKKHFYDPEYDDPDDEDYY